MLLLDGTEPQNSVEHSLLRYSLANIYYLSILFYHIMRLWFVATYYLEGHLCLFYQWLIYHYFFSKPVILVSFRFLDLKQFKIWPIFGRMTDFLFLFFYCVYLLKRNVTHIQLYTSSIPVILFQLISFYPFVVSIYPSLVVLCANRHILSPANWRSFIYNIGYPVLVMLSYCICRWIKIICMYMLVACVIY